MPCHVYACIHIHTHTLITTTTTIVLGNENEIRLEQQDAQKSTGLYKEKSKCAQETGMTRVILQEGIFMLGYKTL